MRFDAPLVCVRPSPSNTSARPRNWHVGQFNLKIWNRIIVWEENNYREKEIRCHFLGMTELDDGSSARFLFVWILIATFVLKTNVILIGEQLLCSQIIWRLNCMGNCYCLFLGNCFWMRQGDSKYKYLDACQLKWEFLKCFDSW